VGAEARVSVAVRHGHRGDPRNRRDVSAYCDLMRAVCANQTIVTFPFPRHICLAKSTACSRCPRVRMLCGSYLFRDWLA